MICNFKKIGLLTLIVGVVLSLQSCLKDSCEATQLYLRLAPVFLSAEDIRQDIKVSEPRALKKPGKLYFYNDFILINERREGIHVIDNTDSSNPKNIKFIEINGNVDMAVKNSILYADNITDLLAIDITNPSSPVLSSRTEDVFDVPFSEENGYLAYYKETEETLEIDCTDPRFGSLAIDVNDDVFILTQPGEPFEPWIPGNADIAWADDDEAAFPGVDFDTDPITISTGQTGGNTTGIAGSMASFALYDCYLYVIDGAQVDVLDVKNNTKPVFANTFSVANDIETLFPYKDKLFIGSSSGMYIYDNSNPLEPKQLSRFQHARACDPVVVKDNYAYVTLRDGTWCEGFENQLDVVDVTDLLNPELVASYEMDNPHGLSVKNDELYLCDGASGLKVFDITDVEAISENQLAHIMDFDTYDAIALPNKDVLFVIGADGFYQYDISKPAELQQLSLIAVAN